MYSDTETPMTRDLSNQAYAFAPPVQDVVQEPFVRPIRGLVLLTLEEIDQVGESPIADSRH
jgi:hypothetical protein